MAKSFGVPSRRVIAKSELRAAVREMLDTPGPYLLDIMVPHVEHVLPMIPGMLCAVCTAGCLDC
jgi:acetolactate synthase-1/2/3 large subunit